MRVAFLGTPDFAAPCLAALAASPDIEVVLVVTRPDRPAGRGRRMSPPPIAEAAVHLGIPIFQPESLAAPEAVATLRAAGPDVLVVVAYGELLRRDVLQLAPHGALNVHPSLLPRFRGAAPIPAAILAGDDRTGVSIIKLVRRLDAGPIIAQQQLDITPDDTSATLGARLAAQAAAMLPSVCLDWVAGRLIPREQDEAQATYCREWTREDGRIDWSIPADQIERLIRAAIPWPIGWTSTPSGRLLIHRVSVADRSASVGVPGTVRAIDRAIIVETGAGLLELRVVQPEGRAVMPAADWWRGVRRTSLLLES